MEEQYNDLITAAEKILNPRAINSQTSASPSTTVNGSSGVKLPKIDLPRFNGRLEQWLAFKAQFSSLIDNQVTLTNTQKLHYLKAALSGEAAETIDSLDIIKENYVHAWDLLNQNYASKRFIVWCHGELLLEVPPIERHSAMSIRRFTNTIRQHVKSLKTL
ncbi:hypothetical protein WH47_02371 [Habropoda laboriosa]|uniref:Uncharacterized protein n=2 Tax=Habropoda laboriosa TaxID=597456 RepID=A0A0L7RK10_9HYME|nr:hypothetical protein WH47_02371 [Habropoda laboriosa]